MATSMNHYMFNKITTQSNLLLVGNAIIKNPLLAGLTLLKKLIKTYTMRLIPLTNFDQQLPHSFCCYYR